MYQLLRQFQTTVSHLNKFKTNQGFMRNGYLFKFISYNHL